MACVDGNCVDAPPEDVSGSEKDGDVFSIVTQPDSAGSGGLVVRTECPEGQIFQYGMCHTPVPDSHYNSSESTEAGGCSIGDELPSAFLLLLWMAMLSFYVFLSRRTRE